MMAPYAVAHMKLAMILKDTGYDFSSDERLRVMLTNSLEPANDVNMYGDSIQMSFISDPLAMESADASRTKNNQGINVIIGNPPYSGISSNNNEYISNLINDYKYINGEYFNERKHWLNDDYVKFIRYSEEIISKNGNGILAFINNNGFLANPTFRCMRYHLLQSFDEIYIIDLHGNSKKQEKSPDGSKDENVFDIMQGVSINIFVKKSNSNQKAVIYHCDIFGERQSKYDVLNHSAIVYKEIQPQQPYYLFVPNNMSSENSYNNGFSVNDLFIINTTGIVTMADEFIVADSKLDINIRISDFLETNYTEQDFKEKYNLGKNYPSFVLSNKPNIEFDESKIVKISYRPFDYKYTYFDNKILWRPRTEVFNQFFMASNIGLITARSNKSEDCSHFYISKYMSEAKCGERTTQSAIFPLYTYSTAMGETTREPNLNKEIIKKISEKLNLPFAPDSNGGKTDSFAPIDLLDYIYAVLHSPKYRETYKEFLKIDFPRVPYPTEQEMFWKMVAIGRQIRELHLMESTLLDTLITSFNGDGDNTVDKPKYQNGKVYINKNQYFDGVPETAWNFYIGGYQPLQKWLKDRKGRQLSDDDIIHYQKIVVALVETDRLMKEIDEVFEF